MWVGYFKNVWGLVMEKVKCNACGSMLEYFSGETAFCANCNMSVCPDCGSEMERDGDLSDTCHFSYTCVSCGNNITTED